MNTDKPQEVENKYFPGRPNYTGSDEGYGAFVHHNTLFEFCPSFRDRVEIIINTKPANEVPIRLYHLLYLPFIDHEWLREYGRQIAQLWAEYERKEAPLCTEYERKKALLDAPVLDFIRQHIPDHRWNGTDLVFPPKDK